MEARAALKKTTFLVMVTMTRAPFGPLDGTLDPRTLAP